MNDADFERFKKEFDQDLASLTDKELIVELEQNKTQTLNLKPNSFWKVWYECRPSVVQITPDGKGFFALGQDAIWGLDNAEFIEEIKMFPVSYFSGQKFVREGVQFRIFSSRHDDGAYLMNFDTNRPVTNPILVKDHSNITFDEFSQMCGEYSVYSFNPVP